MTSSPTTRCTAKRASRLTAATVSYSGDMLAPNSWLILTNRTVKVTQNHVFFS